MESAMNIEISLDPIQEAFLNIETARIYLLQCYSDTNTIFPLKEHIRQKFAKEVEEILNYFNNHNDKLLKSDKKQFHASKFANIPKNQIIQKSHISHQKLPTPSQKDFSCFERFFSLNCCKKLKCTVNIGMNLALDIFKQFIALSPVEQDFFIYGQLHPFSREIKSDKGNNSLVFDFHVHKIRCCRVFFQFIHGMKSDNWLNFRIKNFKEKKFEVVDQRGGTHNFIPLNERILIHSFIDNYLQPILLESSAKDNVLLPCSFTIQEMYKKYQELGGTRSFSAIYSHFKDFWPDLKKIPSYSDYCSTCFVKRKLINVASDEEEETQIREDLQEHLDKAKSAREQYKVVNIGKAKLLNEKELKCISFDWGQNWDIPRFNKQPGELYFLPRQKVGIFGVNDEGLDIQTFFLVPERDLMSYGKGPNATLSYVYYYLKNILSPTNKLVVYADNCAAQNKNNYLLWFFHWLVHTCNSYEEVEINFLLAGHTKFSPGRHFGYAKSELNRTESFETVFDAADIIRKSVSNQRVLMVRDWNSGTQSITIFDWKKFLSNSYKKSPPEKRIFHCHYFKIQINQQDIQYRKYHNSEPMQINLMKKKIDKDLSLESLHLEPLTETRIEELKKLEPFINLHKRDDFWKAVS